MKTIKKYFYSLYLWFFHRNEWLFVSERFIGKRRLNQERPDSPIVDLIEKIYEHKKTGYIRKPKYYK